MEQIKFYMQTKGASVALILLVILWMGCATARADWETGAGIGFDSNIDRAIDNGQSDTYLTAYISLLHEPSGESRLDWSGSATLQGAAYTDVGDLNYVLINISPGLTYFPHALWAFGVSPFVEASSVNDSDQSALDLGVKLSINQQINDAIYSGQYYIYRDSSANVETYSFTEHVLGAFLGMDWGQALFTEVGYEFSRGDSFRAIASTAPVPSGMGRHRRYAQVFGSDVVRDDIDQHAIGVSAGMDWSESFFTRVSYSLRSMKGDLGSSTAHAGMISMGWHY